MDKKYHIRKIRPELLKKYFLQQCDEKERDEVLDYFVDESLEADLKALLFKHWNEIPLDLPKIDNIDSDRIFDRLYRLIHTKERKEEQRISNFQNIYHIFSKIAAVLFIPLLVYVGWTFSGNPFSLKNSKTNYAEIYSPLGARTHFELSDGTSGWLNSGSTLRFPVRFSGKSRKVHLIGEGYFNVAKDPENPFVVKVRNIEVMALGTKFNVLGYSEEKTVDVTLESGKVVVNKVFNNGKRMRITAMKPGQQVNAYVKSNKYKRSKVDTHTYTSWKQGLLIFRNEPMNSVITRLERWYNVDIILDDDEIKEYRYRATFEDETIEEVLSFMKITSPIDYKIHKREKNADGTFTKKTIEIFLKKHTKAQVLS